MKINYQDQKIRKSLSSEKEANRKYGKSLAEKIFKVIQYLEAAPDLFSVSPAPPIRRHKLEGNYEGHFAVDLTKNIRLIFRPIDSFMKVSYQLNEIKDIYIVAIEDYH